MKTYIATYYRHNPQLSNGGYQTTRKIEAVSITSARKFLSTPSARRATRTTSATTSCAA